MWQTNCDWLLSFPTFLFLLHRFSASGVTPWTALFYFILRIGTLRQSSWSLTTISHWLTDVFLFGQPQETDRGNNFSDFGSISVMAETLRLGWYLVFYFWKALVSSFSDFVRTLPPFYFLTFFVYSCVHFCINAYAFTDFNLDAELHDGPFVKRINLTEVWGETLKCITSNKRVTPFVPIAILSTLVQADWWVAFEMALTSLFYSSATSSFSLYSMIIS